MADDTLTHLQKRQRASVLDSGNGDQYCNDQADDTYIYKGRRLVARHDDDGDYDYYDFMISLLLLL